MAGIKATRFAGIAPRFAEELLPDGFAQVAQNCKLTSGDLVPYRDKVAILDETVTDTQTIFPLLEGSTYYWLMWGVDVNVARSSVAGITTQRIYYTGNGVPKATDIDRATFRTTETKTAVYTQLSGDYQKTIKWTTAGCDYDLLAAATAGNQFAVVVYNAAATGDVTIDPNGAETVNGGATLAVTPGLKYLLKCNGTAWTATLVTTYPIDSFDLGVPAPTGACTAAYSINAQAGAYNVVAGDKGKSIDCSGTPWTLTLTAAATLGNTFICVVRNLGTGTLTIDPNGAELINGAATTTLLSGEVETITCNGTAFSSVPLEGSFKGYVYTYVTEWGEESAPSPVSNLLLHTSGQYVNLSGFPSAPPAGNYNIKKYRIYRSNTTVTGTEYQFVAEQNISATTTYSDTKADGDLGDVIETTDYAIPPTGLKGIVNLSNGMTVGFTGNEICYCEPYNQHAWPLAYRYAVDSPIVAIEEVNNNVVIGTQGHPYIATGNHPSSVTLYPADLPYPCLSKRGMVNMGTGVLYPTYEGLVYAAGGSFTLATKPIFTRDEWTNYYPDTMMGRYYDGKYFGYYTTDAGAQGSFIMQLAGDKLPLFVTTNIWASAGYGDPQTGVYFFIQNGVLYQWDAPSAAFTRADWQSKEFCFERPLNLGAARIYADYDGIDYASQNAAVIAANAAIDDELGYLGSTELGADIEVGSDLFEGLMSAAADSSVLFQLYTDGELRWQRYVSSDNVFRLPSGYKTDNVSFRVSSKLSIHGVVIGETPTGLEKIGVG